MSELPIGNPTEYIYNFAQIDEYHVRHLEGMLLTVIDSLGFEKEPKREKAVKDLVRQQVWTWFAPHQSAANVPKLGERTGKKK